MSDTPTAPSHRRLLARLSDMREFARANSLGPFNERDVQEIYDAFAVSDSAPKDRRTGTSSRSLWDRTERRKAVCVSAAPQVWEVSNRTSSVLFATQELAKQYVASFGAATGGGMFVTNREVIGATPPKTGNTNSTQST